MMRITYKNATPRSVSIRLFDDEAQKWKWEWKEFGASFPHRTIGSADPSDGREIAFALEL